MWKYRNPEYIDFKKDPQAIELARTSGLSPLATKVCVNRGISTQGEIEPFLNPKLDAITHPFRILDLEKAAVHVFESQNREVQKKIRVFTDYDVDGTTGAALLTWFFKSLQFKFDVVQPDRMKDGYGLNPGAVIKAHEDGVDTLITVDCGITNFEAALKAQELGIHLVIVDHHQIDPVKGLPPAFAIIDPQRSDDPSGLKQLCGCALGFYLSMGIRIKAREAGYFEQKNIKEPNLRSLLDLVVIATAADMVPLTGDNRALVKQGLDVLRETDKPGLRALIESAGVEVKTMSPSNLGFALGPRINASGRLGSAETAYRVLTTENAEEGRRLAQELESINSDRMKLQNLIWDNVREKVTMGIEEGRFSHAVVVASQNWHEGVVGIVASKVTEHFKKPAIVLAIREDGHTKGSVRSFGGFNVLEALHQTQDLLLGYGGHKYAAGLSLNQEKVRELELRFNESIQKSVPSESGKGDLTIEARADISDFTMSALQDLERLAPFGTGNPEPNFEVVAMVSDYTILKMRHLRLKLIAAGSSKPFEAVWFNAAERIENTDNVERSKLNKILLRFAGTPEINRFMGRVNPTLRIKDAQID